MEEAEGGAGGFAGARGVERGDASGDPVQRDWSAYGVTGTERRERKETKKTSGRSDEEERELQRRYNQALTGGDMDTVRQIDRARKEEKPAPQTRDWTYGLTGAERRERQESVHRQLDEINRRALDPSVNQNPTAMNQLNQQGKKLRASIGEQTWGDRLESWFGASSVPGISAVFNAAGLGADTAMAAVDRADGIGDRATVQHEIDRYQSALDTGRTWDGTAVTPEMRAEFQEILRELREELGTAEERTPFEERHKILAPVLTKVRDEAYRVADEGREIASREQEAAKAGFGKGGRLAVDVGVAAGQMGMDALTAAILGGGSVLGPMSFRSGSLAAQEARLAGADLGQQWAYGAGNAAIAAGTSLGAGKLKDLADREMILRLMLEEGAGKAGLAGAVGALEGGVRTGLQSAWRRTYDPDAEIDWLSVWYNAAIGGFIEGGKAAIRGAVWGGRQQIGAAQMERPRSLPNNDHREKHFSSSQESLVPYQGYASSLQEKSVRGDTSLDELTWLYKQWTGMPNMWDNYGGN